MIQQTSLAAFGKLTSLGRKQAIIFNIIKRYGGITDHNIQKVLGWPINTITPRRRELVKLGLIRPLDTVDTLDTNRKAILWGVCV